MKKLQKPIKRRRPAMRVSMYNGENGGGKANNHC